MTLRAILIKLRTEAGFAVPIAMAVMTVALGLAAAGVAWSVSTSSQTSGDANRKAALTAADAGVRVAAYRLNEFEPTANQCPPQPGSSTMANTTGPLCTVDGPETLGNGATFEYWTSREMQPGDTCVGPSVSSSASDTGQRCITAIGTVNGVSERVQERIVQYTSTPVFPTAIFGTKSVTIGDNETIISDTLNQHALLGTNGVLTVGGVGGGTTQIDGYSLPPGASLQYGSNVTDTGPTTPRTSPYPVPTAINPGTTNQNTSSPYDTPTTFQGGTCSLGSPLPSGDIQTNCDYRITCPDVQSCDPHIGTINFDAANRTLYLDNNSSLVLGGGVYNFCSLYLSNNSSITIAPGATVDIYIDGPADHGACANSNSNQGVAPGTFSMQQNSVINAGGSALHAQVYVYGDPATVPPTNNVTLTNNGSSAYLLVAPFSNVNISPSNNTIFKGAIVGYTVTIGNSGHFTYEADSDTLQTGSLGLFYRSYWEQCAGPGSTGAPTSGC
jgi:Tfp pilus assembly protein PilX